MKLLKSIAFIPDGHRTYAHLNNISTAESWNRGVVKAKEVMEWCLSVKGLKTCTFYALSTENLKRSAIQLKTLFYIYRRHFNELLHNTLIHKEQVRVKFFGSSRVLKKFKKEITALEAATKKYNKHFLNIALGYSGKKEIIDAAKRLKEKNLDFTEENLQKELQIQDEPGLLVRTSGVKRLSNFLPWQTTYTELYFTDKMWPDFSKKDLNDALEYYTNTNRRFGK